MNFIIRILVTAGVAYILSMVMKPHVVIDSYFTAIVFVIVLGLLNAIVKPILVILTLPITILTLGIFLLILNILMTILAGKFVDGIHIDGFWWALIFGFLLSVLTSAISRLEEKK